MQCSSGERHERCREHTKRQHHDHCERRYKRLPFRLRRQPCASGCSAVQAPTLLRFQRRPAQRTGFLRSVPTCCARGWRGGHAHTPFAGGRRIWVGSSSSTRLGSVGSAWAGSGLVATGAAVGLMGGSAHVLGVAGGVDVGAGVDVGSGAEVAGVACGGVTAGVAVGASPGVDIGVDVGAGGGVRADAATACACTGELIGAVEIGRSAFASNASPQPGQKRSSLP